MNWHDQGGVVTQSLYDGDDLLMELDGAGKVVLEYMHFPGVDQPYRMRSGGQVYYYAMEQPGHVTGLLNSANQVANRYTYDDFGRTVVDETVTQPLRYMAREHDSATGLYYVRARWYDPEMRRFVSEDPIRLDGGINVYAYAGNDPINHTDPSGLTCQRVTHTVWEVTYRNGVEIDRRVISEVTYLVGECDGGGGGGGGSPGDQPLTPAEYSRAECVGSGYLVDPARSTFLGMLSRGEVVTGSRLSTATAWADQPYSGPMRIIVAPGRNGALAAFSEVALAQVFAHEVRHVYQGLTNRDLARAMGWGEAAYNAWWPTFRGWMEYDAYGNQQSYIRPDVSRGPSCPVVPSP